MANRMPTKHTLKKKMQLRNCKQNNRFAVSVFMCLNVAGMFHIASYIVALQFKSDVAAPNVCLYLEHNK